MISILPRENYEKFVALQRAVKTACSELPQRLGAGDGEPHPDALSDYVNLKSGRKEVEDIGQVPMQQRFSLPSLNARSADIRIDSRGHNVFTFDGPQGKSGSETDTSINAARSYQAGGRRRFASASESTIASRSKARPEAKFQKLATSQILSQMRKESQKIARNPERFLEGLYDDKEDSIPFTLQSKCLSHLLNDIDKDTATKGYETSLTNLQQRCRQAKNKTLLLSLKSNPIICSKVKHGNSDSSLKSGASSNRSISSSQSTPVTSSRFSPFFNGPAGDKASSSYEEDVSKLLDYSMEDNADIVLQSFLDEIRHANVDNIISWVDTPALVNDLELPFGLPTSTVLKLPTGNLANLSHSCTEFIKMSVEEFLLLDAEYHAKLEELRERITNNFRDLELAKWQGKDTALLFHLMNLTQQNGSHFSSEKLCTEVATRIFPMYSREEIVAQKYRLKVKKALEEKRDSIIKHWLKDKENLVKRVNGAWEDIQKKEKVQEDLQLEKKRQQERCQFWTELLEKMRKENRKKVRTIQTLVEPLEEQLRRKQKLKDQLEKERRLEQKEMIDKFQRLRMESEEDHKRRQEEIQMLLEKDRKIRQIHNRARVHMRKKEFEERQKHQKELERKREEEKLKRLELLERTKEKVEIPYHPANVLSDTHASLSRVYETQALNFLKEEETEEAVRFFRERYSFSAETLWKDTRVRLESKLREAGLIDNSYARHVLLAMQPKPKPHLQSQIKFDD